MNSIRPISTRSRWLALALAACALGVGGFAALHFANSQPSVPTVEVRRGEFVDYLELRGRLKAVRSVVVNAPSDAQDLQILHLVRPELADPASG